MRFVFGMESLFGILRKVLSVYGILLIVMGTLANILSFLICIKIGKNITFIFLSYLSIINIFTIYHWNLENILLSFFNVDWLNFDLLVCKLGNFIQFTSLQSSAWILVAMSIEQFLSVKIKIWRKKHFKPKYAYLVCSGIVVLFIAVNINVLVTFGQKAFVNNTLTDFCFNDINFIKPWMGIYGTVHLAIYSIIPFILLSISNISLIFYIKKSKKCLVSSIVINNKKQHSNIMRQRMNKTIIYTTALFILMTLPTATTSLFYTKLIASDGGLFLIRFFNSISFSFHGLNFFVHLLFNKKFRAVFFVFLNTLLKRY